MDLTLAIFSSSVLAPISFFQCALIAPSFPTRKKVCRSENFQQAKAAEAEAEAEAKKAEAEAAPMRLMNQKKEEEDKEKEGQQKKGAQNNKDEYIETDVNNNDSDDEVLATQDKVDNTDRPPVGKRRCVKKQSPVVADSDVRDRKKARVVAVSVSKKTFFQKSQKALETKVLELSTRLESFEKTVEARFKETNALISKVLTKMTRADPFPALADTVRSERENSIARTEHKTKTVRSEQKNNTVRTKRKAARGSIDQIQKSNNKATKLSPIKEKVSMGLTFRFCETLDDFLDGYNARLLMSPEQLSKLTSGEKSTRCSYLYYWKPFATVFRDAISDFETLFGEKAGDYIGEFEVAMEEALCSDVRSDCPNRNASKSQKRCWKTVASEFISASSETREKMRMSWNLKGIMNQMHLKTHSDHFFIP